MSRLILYVVLSLFSASGVFVSFVLQSPKDWTWGIANIVCLIMNTVLVEYAFRALLKKRREHQALSKRLRNVRVGQRLRIYEGEDHRNQYKPIWYVTKSGLITEEMWERIKDFQEPVPMPPEEQWPYLARMNPGLIEAWQGSEYYEAVQRKLKMPGLKSPTSCWEFDALAKIDSSVGKWIRMYAFYNGDEIAKIVRWTWTDMWIRRPLHHAFAWLRTKYARIGWKPHEVDRCFLS